MTIHDVSISFSFIIAVTFPHNLRSVGQMATNSLQQRMPVPEVLRRAIHVVRDAQARLKSAYGILPGTADTLRQLYDLLPTQTRDVLPDRIQDMTIFEWNEEVDSAGEEDEAYDLRWQKMKQIKDLESTLIRTLRLVDLPQQEKIPLSDKEIQEVRCNPSVIETKGVTLFFYGQDIRRLDNAVNEHRFLPEDWRCLDEGDVVKFVAVKDRHLVASLLADIQWKTRKYLILQAAVHPAIPESGPLLMEYFLSEAKTVATIAMAVKERRDWLWKLLRSCKFESRGISHDHYRFMNGYEDAFCMYREQ